MYCAFLCELFYIKRTNSALKDLIVQKTHNLSDQGCVVSLSLFTEEEKNQQREVTALIDSGVTSQKAHPKTEKTE